MRHSDVEPQSANETRRPIVKQGFQLIVYPTKHLEATRGLLRELLGVAPYVDGPYYVGFRVGEQEIGLDPNGHAKGQTGPIGYADVDDIQARKNALVAAGATVRQDVNDVGGGLLICWLEDADGNIIGLRQAPAGGR
jgi:predicted enzyme related to lactoylglutathione lyase